MATDPVSSYLTEKHAAGRFSAAMGGFRSGAQHALTGGKGLEGFGHTVGNAAALGGLAAGGALAVAGGGHLVSKLYDVATKSRDFKAMLAENPDLAAKHEENPRQVNRFFTTLRTFNPSFSSDPIVAGNYVRQMVDDPLHAGGTVEKSIPFKDSSHPVRDVVTRAALGAGKKDEKKK